MEKVLVVIAAVLVVAGVAGHVVMKNMGKVKVPKFEKLSENTYAYSEGLNQSNMYLLLGEERAMLIDTANGLSDIPAGLEEITDLPVFVVSTHGHYDHIRGNHFFEERYMSVKDDEVYSRHRTAEEVERQMESISPAFRFLLKYENQTIMNTLDCQHFFRQIFSGYFPDIVQAFDTLGRNVYGDDYTSLHNPIVLSSVLLVYGMFHSTQILF